MPARVLLAVPTILLFAAMLPAQLGVGPGLIRPLAWNPDLTPPGASRVTDLTIVPISNHNYFVGVTWQQSLTGPRLTSAYGYDRTTNTRIPLNDFSSLTMNTESISMSEDLRILAWYDIGIGPRAYKRASVASPWTGPHPIPNLPSGAYGLEFCKIKGNPSLLCCFNDPAHAPIEIFDFDPNTLSVSNPSSLQPPLGNPSNFVAFAIPLDDALGETDGIAVCIRQPLGFQEQLLFTPGVDGTSAWYDWFQPPTNSFLVGGDQLAGGHLVGANSGLPFSSLQNGSIDMVGTFTFDAIGSTQGGSLALTMMGPTGGFGVFAIATSLVPSVTVPGFLNEFGLDAGGIIGTFFLPMPDGIGEVTLAHQPTTPFVVPTQSVSFDTTFVMWHQAFGNTAELGFQ